MTINIARLSGAARYAESNTVSAPHVSICRCDQVHKCRGIDVPFGSEFHMSHELAGAFQETLWVGDLGSTKESNVDVIFERIDITESGVADTRSRMAIMQ